MDTLAVIGVVFLAVFTQSLAGFGVALVAMALLPGLVGLKVATPLVALVAMALEVLLVARYRGSINLGAVWRVTLASAVGVPLGILALRRVDERLVLGVLGVVIAGYALYALFNLRPPRLSSPALVYGIGFLAGMLGGAYNTPGPPVIVYADSQGWPPLEFKGNLQGFFIFNSALVAMGHALAGNFAPQVWRLFALALPAIAVGFLAGTWMDRVLDPDRFRKVVLVMLFLMGLRLLVG